MRRVRQPAFSLLELLLVVALIGLLVLFAWPDYTGMEHSEKLRESGRRMSTLIAMCRAEAMNEACRYRVIIRPDGSVKAKRQLDPVLAPHAYVSIDDYWGESPLVGEIWVESVEVLPEGPAPYRIIDEELILADMEVEPVPVEENEHDIHLDIEPDGSTPSARWVLRDEHGYSLLQTLDGRLGRVQTEDWMFVPPEDLERPEPLEEEEEDEPELEDFDYER